MTQMGVSENVVYPENTWFCTEDYDNQWIWRYPKFQTSPYRAIGIPLAETASVYNHIEPQTIWIQVAENPKANFRPWH